MERLVEWALLAFGGGALGVASTPFVGGWILDYREVGVPLNVRPNITTEGNVDLEINLELSNIVPGEILFGGFIFDRRETTTKVSVKNGQTIVLSGILRDEESEITRKVPFFGDIPLLGWLFTSRDKETTRT